MSYAKIQSNTSGTGVITVLTPNTNTDRTLLLPDATDTLVGATATQTLTNKSIGAADGTAAAPSIFRSASTSTGIWFPAANTMAVSTGSTERMRIAANGDVNIAGNTLSVGGNNVSPVQSFRNKIINGNFDFWQRSTSSSTAGYISDRWSMGATGSTFTTSRQAFTLGQTAVPNEPTYFHRTVVSSVAGAANGVGQEHRIESVRTLAGQTATLSFWAKADASKNIAVEFIQVFGTGGSPSSSITGISPTTCALTTSWQKFTITVSVPSISGKTLGTDNNDYLSINIWFDAGSNYNSRTNTLGQQSGTFDIAQVQLEAGSVATPFEVRPMQTELALCQRYYQISTVITNSYGAIYASGPGTFFGVPISFNVPMRVSPTGTYSSLGTGANFWVIPGTTPYSASSVTGITISTTVRSWAMQHARQAGNSTPTSGNYYTMETAFDILLAAEL